MALDNPALNATLITSGSAAISLLSDGDKFLSGTVGQADHFVIDNQFGNTMSGAYTVTNFGKNDSFLAKKKIFDGNNDGIIDFGDNAVLDSERTAATKAGDTRIGVGGEDLNAVTGLRYLGNKDGYFVYADASVRLAGFTELTVGDNTFDAGTGSFKLFYDNALGLNLGGDTINNFGADDLLITTKALFNSATPKGETVKTVSFGDNGVLDLSGSLGPLKTDPADNNINVLDAGDHPGGQIAFTGLTHVTLTNDYELNGVHYYEYSIA